MKKKSDKFRKVGSTQFVPGSCVVSSSEDYYSAKNDTEMKKLIMQFKLAIDMINGDENLPKEEKSRIINKLLMEMGTQSFLVKDMNRSKFKACVNRNVTKRFLCTPNSHTDLSLNLHHSV